MTSDDLLKARYDETPYRDQVFEDLDLSRLLGLAKLFSLGPSLAEGQEIRVLDLACASGEHIRQQAARYPKVRFTGVDFSQIEIDAGLEATWSAALRALDHHDYNVNTEFTARESGDDFRVMDALLRVTSKTPRSTRVDVRVGSLRTDLAKQKAASILEWIEHDLD